jgi:tRNA dimethylallyltransferase
MHGRDEIPIVVGGTSYWLQHLIFPNRLVATPERTADSPSSPTPTAVPDPELLTSIGSLTPEMRRLYDELPEDVTAIGDPFELHTLLAALDPVIAETWHWRDVRKVLHSLSIMRKTGRRPSLTYQGQSQEVQRPRFDHLPCHPTIPWFQRFLSSVGIAPCASGSMRIWKH